MTAKENTTLERLCRDVGELTGKVDELVSVHKEIHQDMYGIPGDKEDKPGLMGDVAELKRAHKTQLFVLRGGWAAVVAAIGAAAGALVKTCF